MAGTFEYIIQAGGFDDATNWGDGAGRPALIKQVQAVMNGEIIKTAEQAGEHMARGGQWAIYYEDAKNDLRDVFGVKPSGDDWEDWARYCRECGRAVAKIYRGAE